MSSLKEIRTEFIHLYESIFTRRGLPPIMGRIVAVFLLEERELTQQEISELVGYSVSSVNRALDDMISRGILSKRKDARSLRQFVYRMNLDMREMAGGILKVVIESTTTSIEELRSLLNRMVTLKPKKAENDEFLRIKTILRKNEEYLASLIQILEGVLTRLNSS